MKKASPVKDLRVKRVDRRRRSVFNGASAAVAVLALLFGFVFLPPQSQAATEITKDQLIVNYKLPANNITRQDQQQYFYTRNPSQTVETEEIIWMQLDNNPTQDNVYKDENGVFWNFVSWSLYLDDDENAVTKCINESVVNCNLGNKLTDASGNGTFTGKTIPNVTFTLTDSAHLLTEQEKTQVEASSIAIFKTYQLFAVYNLERTFDDGTKERSFVSADNYRNIKITWKAGSGGDLGPTVQPEVSWSVSNSEYRVSTAETAKLELPLKITWKDSTTGAVLRKGHKVLDKEQEQKEIHGFYFGIVPVDENDSIWRCDGNFIDSCDFRFKTSSIESGEFDDIVIVNMKDIISSDNRGHSVVRVKVVPALDMGSEPDWYADAGTSKFITLNISPNADREGGEVVLDSPPVSAESIAAVNADTSSFDNFLTGTLLSIINVILVAILGLVRLILVMIKAILVLPIIEALLQPDGFLSAAKIPTFVRTIWIYVRDIMNLAFILILLYSAIRTMLGSDKYGLGKTLPRIIIMAIVVNLSLLAGQVVLYFAQVLLNFFINPTTVKEIAAGINLFGQDSKSFEIFSLNAGEALNGTAILGFTIIYEIGVVIVLGAMAALLLVRLLGLWILLMVSPAAYVLYISADTEEYLGKWWDMFLRYAFFAPIMAFFLAITHVMVNSPDYMEMSGIVGAQSGDVSRAIITVAQGLIGLAMLAVSLKVAQKMSIAGADVVTKKAQDLWKGVTVAPAGKGLGALAKGQGRYWSRKYGELTHHLLEQKEGKPPPGKVKKALFAITNPKAVYKGFEKRAEEIKHHHEQVSEALGRQVYESSVTKGQLNIPYAQLIERSQENEYLKQYEGMSKEQLMRRAVELEDMEGHEGEVRRRAIVKALAAGGYIDDVKRMKHFANKYADEDGTVDSAQVTQRFLRGFLGDSEQSMRLVAEDLEELGKKTGHFEYVGQATFDAATNTWKWGMDEEGDEIDTGRIDEKGNAIKVKKMKNWHQAKYAASEFAKLGGRDRAKAAPHNFKTQRAKLSDWKVDKKTGKKYREFIADGDEITDISWGREDGELDEFSIAMLAKMDADVIREAQHLQQRLRDILIGAEFDGNRGEAIAEDEASLRTLDNYWRENHAFMKVLFGKHLGLEGRQAASLPGMNIGVKTDDGGKKSAKEVLGHSFGNVDALEIPIAINVASEIVTDDSKVYKHLSEKETIPHLKLAIADAVESIEYGEKDIEQAMRDIQLYLDKKNIPEKDQKEIDWSDLRKAIVEKMVKEKGEHYNPSPVVEEVIAKISDELKRQGRPQDAFRVGEDNKLVRAISTAVVRVFEETMKNNVKIASPEHREALRNAIQDGVEKAIPGGPVRIEMLKEQVDRVINRTLPTDRNSNGNNNE